MRVSSVFKITILGCLSVFMGLLLIFSNVSKGTIAVYQMVIAVIGLLLAIIAVMLPYMDGLSKINKKKLIAGYKKIHIFMFPYSIILLYEIVHTYNLYGYNKITLLYAITPYLYAFFSYPLMYIFVIDHGYKSLLKKVGILGVIMTLIRVIGWYLYNYRGSYIFSGLVLQSEDWLRNGLQRIDVIPLFGIVTVYYAYRLLREYNLYNFTVTLFLFLYLVFIAQARYLVVIVVILFVILLYLKPNSNKYEVLFRGMMTILLIFGILFGGVNYIIMLFSTNGAYGASTSIRFEAMEHFYNLIVQNKQFFGGLGLLTFWNSKASLLMMKNIWQNYYLSDIGIVGGLVVFGMLGIIIYGCMYYIGIKASIMSSTNKDKWDKVIIYGLFIYMVLSCMSLNIFDMNRSMDVPFYLAIFCYSLQNFDYFEEKSAI